MRVLKNKRRYTGIQYLCSFLILITLCLNCTGCITAEKVLENLKNRDTDEPYVSDEAEAYNKAVDDFFAALDAGDKEAIRDMFSVAVQNEDTDLEEQIDRLIENYSGPTDYCGRDGRVLAAEYSNDYGTKSASADSTFPVISEGTYYWCHFVLTYQNDFDEDQIGITQVLFFSDNDFCDLRYDHDGTYSEEPGLSVYFDYPLDCEIRSIEGWPLQYTATDSVLEEEEVTAFLEESDSYTEFTEQFGLPNAIEIYYYYELPSEDGQPRYLVLSVSEEEDIINSASVADDLDWVYELWDRDEES